MSMSICQAKSRVFSIESERWRGCDNARNPDRNTDQDWKIQRDGDGGIPHTRNGDTNLSIHSNRNGDAAHHRDGIGHFHGNRHVHVNYPDDNHCNDDDSI